MATSELLGQSQILRLRQVSTVDAASVVRHVDQLDEETLTAFYDAIERDRSLSAREVDLEPGEVIVFTDYYRVERGRGR